MLSSFNVTEETYKYQFQSTETFNWIKGLYKRWTRRDSRSKEEIGETVILEQFLHMLHPDVCTWVKENNPKTEEEAANLAECYLAPHR